MWLGEVEEKKRKKTKKRNKPKTASSVKKYLETEVIFHQKEGAVRKNQ